MLISNIGVNTEGADLLNIKSNEGYSDVVVDIASYINTRLPLIKNHSLTKGRGFYDVRRLGRLSGKKYMLTEEIIKTMHAESMADKIWLLDHFGIDYTGVYSKKYVNEVVFGPSYVDEFKCIFVKLKPVIQKLSYDYINEKTLTPSVDEETKSKCKALVPWMDGITCDFKEQNLGYFIENLGGTYKISGTMKIRSSLFFHHVYYKRYGFKKTAKRLTERIFG